MLRRVFCILGLPALALWAGSATAQTRIDSPTPLASSESGSSIAYIGDVDADGVANLVAGSPGSGSGHEATKASESYTLTLDGPEGWQLLAFPTTQTLITQFANNRAQFRNGSLEPSVFNYDETLQGVRDFGFVPSFPNEQTSAIRGYAVYVFEDDDPDAPGVQGGFPKTITAQGLSRSGSNWGRTVSSTGPGSEDGWNLLGNPFGGSLDWDAPGWNRPFVSNTVYVYDAATSAYKSWNGTTGSLGSGIIAPFQGFWIRVLREGSGLGLSIPSGAEVDDPPPVSPAATPTLAFDVSGTLGGKAVNDGAYVAFLDDALDGDDPFDAAELAPFLATFVSLFADADGAALDINALPTLNMGASIPMNIEVAGGTGDETWTLRWPDLNVPDDWALELTDTQTGTSVNLRGANEYAFTTGAASARRTDLQRGVRAAPTPTNLFANIEAASKRTAPRFLLAISEAVVSSVPNAESAFGIDTVRPNPTSGQGLIAVRAPEAGTARLVVHDVLGREVAFLLDGSVAAGRLEVAINASGLAPGVYVVRWTLGEHLATRTITVTR